jgi:branched-chain amino acid transport system permease protein
VSTERPDLAPVGAPVLPSRAVHVRVRRVSKAELWKVAFFFALVLALVALPFMATVASTGPLVTFFVLLTMSTMWNLLAGYAGLVSIGQQAYIGLGAYAVLQLSDWGIHPFVGVILAALVSVLFALPTSWLAFRLRGDYFAVGTWVIADVYRLVIVRNDALGGGSGRSLTTLSDLDPIVRQAVVYWLALGVTTVALVSVYLLLRSRIGLSLTAIRDNEIGASSVGIRVARTKRVVYLTAAAGTGAAGGLLLVSQLGVNPDAIFSVQWSAYMIFIVLIGGIGSLEGPVLGTVIFFALQQTLASQGVWYLILLGSIAVVAAVFAPRGLFALAAERFGLSLFAVGYWVEVPVSAKSRRSATPDSPADQGPHA